MNTAFIFQAIYTMGQVLDVFGAIILFKYGLPPYLPKYGGAGIMIYGDEASKTENYELKSRIGFGLLVVGFLMQFAQSIYNLVKFYL